MSYEGRTVERAHRVAPLPAGRESDLAEFASPGRSKTATDPERSKDVSGRRTATGARWRLGG